MDGAGVKSMDQPGGADAAAAMEDQRAYRRALGAFATGVTLITTQGPAGPIGITVNSFTSVSLSPRLILWCLDDRSDRYPTFSDAQTWAVNVLAAGQEELSARFAASAAAALGDHEFQPAPNGAPWIGGALTRLACRTFEQRGWGDHLVIVGLVEAFDAAPGDGLTYFRGRYGRASSPSQTG